MYVHVVFLSFRNEASLHDKDQVLSKLRYLSWSARDAGAAHWSVNPNFDLQPKQFIGGRTVDIVVMGNFPSHEAFTEWKNSDEHKKVAGELGKMPVDWLVGDVVPENLIRS